MRHPKAFYYNWVVGSLGCYLVTDNWMQCIGLALILEAVLVTIEELHRSNNP